MSEVGEGKLGAWSLDAGGWREGWGVERAPGLQQHSTTALQGHTRTSQHPHTVACTVYICIYINGINSLLLAKRARGKAFRMHGDLATVPTSIWA
jgi:hypothetical protein